MSLLLAACGGGGGGTTGVTVPPPTSTGGASSQTVERDDVQAALAGVEGYENVSGGSTAGTLVARRLLAKLDVKKIAARVRITRPARLTVAVGSKRPSRNPATPKRSRSRRSMMRYARRPNR